MHSQKGIVHLGLILILLVFGIGALGYVMYKTNYLPVITTSSPTPESILQTGDINGWKTYSNSYFSMKYPTNWDITSQTNEYVELVKKDGPFDTVTQKNASLTITSSPKEINYAGCANPYDSTNSLNLDGELLTLGIQKQDKQYLGSVTKNINQCWFSKSNINFGIHYYSSNEISDEIDQILSTFEFIDLSIQDKDELVSEVKRMFINDKGNPAETNQVLLVEDIQINDDWAMGNIKVTAAPGGGPAVWRFMANKVSDTWTSALEYTSQYLSWFKTNGSQFFKNQDEYVFLRDEHYTIR